MHPLGQRNTTARASLFAHLSRAVSFFERARHTTRASARRIDARCETAFHDRVVSSQLRHATFRVALWMEQLFRDHVLRRALKRNVRSECKLFSTFIMYIFSAQTIRCLFVVALYISNKCAHADTTFQKFRDL